MSTTVDRYDSDKENVVSSEMAAYLEGNKYASPIRNNKRRVSRDLLISSPSPPHKKLNFEVMVEIPAKVYSRETYEYMGFTSTTAGLLWGQYCRANDDPYLDMGKDFITIAVEHVRHYCKVDDAETRNDDWLGCLRTLGIRKQIADGIMHPDCNIIRGAHSCKYWVIRIITDAYNHIQGIDEMLRASTALLRSRTGASSSSGQSQTGGEQLMLLPQQSFEVNPPDQSSSPSSASASDTEKPSLPFSKIVMPDFIDHHTMLWRGGSSATQQKLFNSRTGAFNMSLIASLPGDFGSNALTYWTPQKECAEAYRKMTLRTHPDQETCIIQIAVPQHVTTPMSKIMLYSEVNGAVNDQWRQVFFHCRRSERLPCELRDLVQKDIMMGHVASGIHAKFLTMKAPEEIKSRDRLMIPSSSGDDIPAMQWVFRSERAIDAVEDNIKGKVWFHKWSPAGQKVQ